jgi:hypothetical protein
MRFSRFDQYVDLKRDPFAFRYPSAACAGTVRAAPQSQASRLVVSFGAFGVAEIVGVVGLSSSTDDAYGKLCVELLQDEVGEIVAVGCCVKGEISS